MKPIARILAPLLLAAVAVAGVGCGYALVGRSSSLPPTIHSIAVPVFRNLTERPGVEQWLSEAVAREIAGRGGLEVPVSDAEADAVLDGEVAAYSAWASNLDSTGRATEYQIVVTANVRLVTKAGETLLHIPSFQFQETYPVVSGASDSGFSDRENVAVEAISSRFAESLVTAVLEGF